MSTSNSQALATRYNALLGVNEADLTSTAQMIFESGVFGDIKNRGQAAVKIMAGQELGFTPLQSMEMFDFIQNKPVKNAHCKATLINASGTYRLKNIEFTPKQSVIELCRKDSDGNWAVVNRHTFTIEDARQAGLTTGPNKHSWEKYPRNMLFARNVSNIWRWETPELNVRRHQLGSIETFETPQELVEELKADVDAEIILDDTTSDQVIVAEPIADDDRSNLQERITVACKALNAVKDTIEWKKSTLTEYAQMLFDSPDLADTDSLNTSQLTTLAADLEDRLAEIEASIGA